MLWEISMMSLYQNILTLLFNHIQEGYSCIMSKMATLYLVPIFKFRRHVAFE